MNASYPASTHTFHSDPCRVNNNQPAMDESQQQILLRHHQQFTETIDVSLLFPTLHAHKILTMEEINAINQVPSSTQRVERLLDILPAKGGHAFQGFCQALEPNYPHLLREMFLLDNSSGNTGLPTSILLSNVLQDNMSMSISLTSESDEDTLDAVTNDQVVVSRALGDAPRGQPASARGSSVLTHLDLQQNNLPPQNKQVAQHQNDQTMLDDLHHNDAALLQAQLKLVMAERDALRAQVHKPKTKLNSSKNLVSDEMKAAQSLDYGLLRSQYDRSISELKALKRQHAETVKKCERSVKESEYFRNKYKESCEKYESKNIDLRSLQTQFDDLNLVKTRLQQEVTDLQNIHENDLQQIHDLRSQQRDVMNESGSSDILNRMYDTAVDRNDLLRTDYDNMRKRYADLSAVHSLTLNKNEVLQEEIQTLKKQLEEIFVERNGLKQQCTAFIRNWDNALRECNELKDSLNKVTQQKDSYLKEMNEVCAIRLKATKDLARVTEERNAAVKEYSLIMSERDTVHMEIEQLQEKLCQVTNKSSNYERERKLMSNELETLRREISSALSDRDRALKECHDLRARFGDIVVEKESVRKERDDVIRDCKLMAQERDVARKERHEALEHRDQILQETYQKVRQEMADEKDMATKEADQLRKETDKLRKELAEALQEVDVSKRRRDWAFGERDKIVLERESMRTLCDNLRHERDRAVTELAESLRDSDDLRKRRNDLTKELKELRDKYESLLAEGGKRSYQRLSHNHSNDSAIDTEMPDFISDTYQVTVDSDDGVNYGFDLTYSVDQHQSPSEQGYYISSVIKGSSAAGKIRYNDHVIKVNGADISNLERSTVNELIHTSTRQVSLVIRRRRVNSRAVQYVQLDASGGAGSAVQLDMGFYVSRVQPSCAAVRDGAITVGDRVVSVNGASVDRRSLGDITRLIADQQDGVLLGVLRKNTPHSSASSSKHNLIESPVAETKSPPHSTHSSPVKVYSDDRGLKSSSSQTNDSDPKRREQKSQHDTILDRAYEKIIGKFKRSHDEKEKGQKSADQVISELDSVLDGFDSDKRVDGGTWPKVQSPVEPGPAGTAGTVAVKTKVKERAAIPFLEKDCLKGGELFDSVRRRDQGTLKREKAPRPLSEILDRNTDMRPRSSFDQKNPPLPPERGDASFAASVRHSPRSSFNFTKSSPYLSSLAKSEVPPDANKTFSDHDLTERELASSAHAQKVKRQAARSTDNVITRRHVPDADMVAAQRDQDIIERYNRKRPKSAPSRRHQRRGVRRQAHDQPSSLNIRTPQPFADVTRSMTSPEYGVALRSPMTSPVSIEGTSADELHSTSSSRYSTISASGRRQSVPSMGGMVESPSTSIESLPPPQYSPPPSYLSHMESVLSASFPDGDLVSPHGPPPGELPPAYPFPEGVLPVEAVPPYRMHSPRTTQPSHRYFNPSPVHSIQSVQSGPRPYTPVSDDAIPGTPGTPGQEGFSTFPKRHTERIRIPSKSSIGRMSTSSVDAEATSPVYDLASQSSTASLPRMQEGPRPRVGETMNIHIEKSSEPLGIQIRRASSGGIFVSSVNNNSLASRVGITVGHQLLEVCGLNMRTATYQQAANILRQCGNSITMLAQYNPERYEEFSEASVRDSWSGGSSSQLTSRTSSRQSSAANSPTQLRRQSSIATSPAHTVDRRPSLTQGRRPERRGSQESVNSVTPTNSPSLSRKQPSVRRAPFPKSESRYVYLRRCSESAPLGIGLIGGNAVGIYVNDVKADSVAQGQDGLVSGDRILEINGIDIRGFTAEQAAYELSRPSLSLTVLAQYSYSDYLRVKDEAGDAFYVRCMFDRPGENESELAFKQGDILFVENTVCNGEIGLWKAWIVDENGNKMTSGTVTGRTRLEEDTELLHSISEAAMDNDTFKRRGSGSFRRSFFRRRRHTRNSKDSRDMTYCSDASINSDSSTPFLSDYSKPTFHCVQRIESILPRPVMIVGPHADALICKLTSESPDKFSRCDGEQVRASMSAIDRYQSDDTTLDVRKKDTCFEWISVNSVSQITKKNRHCLLDVHPAAVEKLHRAQLYPIVVYIKHKSAKQIREAKDTRFLPEKVSTKSAKELFDHFQKIETDYKHVISAVVTGGNMAFMCMQIKSAIDAEQRKIIWVNNPTANI